MRTHAIIIKPNEKTNSNKLNNQYTNSAQDIADLYRNYIALKNDTEAQNLVLPLSVDAIESQISNIQSLVNTLANGTSIISLYDDDPVIFPSSLTASNRCLYEQVFGTAVLPVASADIEYHFVDPITNEKVLIQNVNDFVKSFVTNNRFEPKLDKLFENSVANAVDLTSNKAHVVKAWAKNADITDLTLVYNLDVEEIRTINCIKIYPIPELASKFRDVALVKSNGVRQTIKDVNGQVVTFPKSNARKTNFRFESTEISSVNIQIDNANYRIIDNVGTKEFVLGARAISLQEEVYLNIGYVGIQATKPSGKTKIGKITPIFEGQAENIEIQVYDNLEEFNKVSNSYIMGGTAQSITETINTTISVDTIYILFKLTKQENNTTPILNGCKIKWQ